MMRNTRVRHITIWLVTLVRKNVIKRYNKKRMAVDQGRPHIAMDMMKGSWFFLMGSDSSRY